VQTYLEALVKECAKEGQSLVSVALFGSAARGGFSEDVSDVDVIIVLGDDTTPESRRRLREDVALLEALHGFRLPAGRSGGLLQARIERAVGHALSCFVCTRGDLLSGDVARVLDLRRLEALFVDRIVLANIIASAVTVWGEDLLPQVPVPSVRRLDVVKALFAFSGQVWLSAVTFPAFPDATRYAMGALKRSLHSCFFCYHQRTAPLEEEVAFFHRRRRATHTLVELLARRGQYRPSFGFVLRCLPTLVRLHLETAWDNQFPVGAVRAGGIRRPDGGGRRAAVETKLDR
jgi:predicted nucleotidyltransferase